MRGNLKRKAAKFDNYIYPRTESSPSGSPKRNKRPVSLVVDGTTTTKPMPAITETTELVSFRDGLTSYGERNLMKNLVFNDLSVQLNGGSPPPPPTPPAPNAYAFNPKVVERAEHLLAKCSLDNADLTVTTLNYIDENGSAVASNGAQKSLKAFFDRQTSQSPESRFVREPFQ